MGEFHHIVVLEKNGDAADSLVQARHRRSNRSCFYASFYLKKLKLQIGSFWLFSLLVGLLPLG